MDWKDYLKVALANVEIEGFSELIYMHGGEQELNRQFWKELDKAGQSFLHSNLTKEILSDS